MRALLRRSSSLDPFNIGKGAPAGKAPACAAGMKKPGSAGL
jgi:hypothetical protein